MENGVDLLGPGGAQQLAGLGVGSSTSSTPRALANSRTYSMTGRRPSAPMRMTSLEADHGIVSSAERGVCPNRSR